MKNEDYENKSAQLENGSDGAYYPERTTAKPPAKTLKQLRTEHHGFITSDADLAAIVSLNRFQQVLVRCGNGRFVCPAQDVKHFTDIIEKSDDYVRDISFPAVDCCSSS